MDYELRVIIEKVSIANQATIHRENIGAFGIKKPKSILDLGLRHTEQISLLTQLQNFLLAEQSILIDPGFTECPKCGEKISKNGFLKSIFHAVFSDHKLRLQKHRCKNPDCNWQSTPTTHTFFGTDTHPDLVKLQCEQGVLNSYRMAETYLAKLNCQRRSVNNHVQIRMITNQIGERLSDWNKIPPSPSEIGVTHQLIVRVEGESILLKGKQRAEVMLGRISKGDDLATESDHKNDASYVMSAINDQQLTMKTYLLNAAFRQGLDIGTHVFAITDGTRNSWEVVSALQSHCQKLELILDWFHICKKFVRVRQGLNLVLTNGLKRAQSILWQGYANDALYVLASIQSEIIDETKLLQIRELREYLQMNLNYLANYAVKDQTNMPYMSDVADFHLEDCLRERHRKQKKMQWTQEGVHNILQIRAMMASHEWTDRFLELIDLAPAIELL